MTGGGGGSSTPWPPGPAAGGCPPGATRTYPGARDRTLPMPKLILYALQINTNAGRLPEPEDNGVRYLKVPMNLFPNAKWD